MISGRIRWFDRLRPAAVHVVALVLLRTMSGCGSAEAAPPGAPAVEGERSAGHARLAFRWSTPEGARAFRARIDEAPWTELPPVTTHWVSPVDLPEGDHLFEVQAQDAEGRWSDSGTFVSTIEYFEQPGFWNGVERSITTTPHGHLCAISAHSGFVTPSAFAPALERIHAAQLAGADLVEIDAKDEGGAITVGHDDGVTGGALLADVLDDPTFGEGDEVLFLELKETTPTADFARSVLDLLEARRDRFARNGRPVVIRAFHGWRRSLLEIAAALEDDRYVFIRPYVRLSELFAANAVADVATFEALVDGAASDGLAMVEFNYRNANLHTLLAYARSLGLGTNLWTIPSSLGEVFVASLREETDVLTVDHPVASARAVAEDATSILYLNAASTTDPSPTGIAYFDGTYEPQLVALDGDGRPSLLVGGPGEALYGGYLHFDRAASAFLPLAHGDANAGEGLLVNVALRFPDLALADGESRVLLASSSSGGFVLLLEDPAGDPAALLRFGVHVGGAYVYASYPVASLAAGRTYDLIGAYDGDGGVHLWVDNSNAGVTNGEATGGVAASLAPITIGADPQDGVAARWFADLDLQVANVQRWGSH